MKSQKGITLTSLVLYIMLVLIVLGILATITASFQSNLKEVNKEGTKNSEIDNFSMYFLKEIKKQGNEVSAISENEISFTTGNKFSFNDNAIYLSNNNDASNIKIAESIENCTFTHSLENGKTVISVTIKARDAEERNIEYVLSNEEYSSANEDENNYIDNNYTEIEYIESTGTQYIKTGIDSNSNLDVYLEFQITSDPSTFTRIFGSRENWQKNAFSIQKLADKKLRIDYGSQNYTDVDVISTNMRYIWRQEQNVLYINNTKVTEFSSTQFNGPELYLFNSNLIDSQYNFEKEFFTGRVFRLKISKANQTLLDLIPVIDSNNTVCLYDKVSEKFYYNQGTGDFIAGPKK